MALTETAGQSLLKTKTIPAGTFQAGRPSCHQSQSPADRIIGASSLIEDIPLLSADREIRGARAVPTIW
jgi:PIN domain nuclease of toxin-antitoxin system